MDESEIIRALPTPSQPQHVEGAISQYRNLLTKDLLPGEQRRVEAFSGDRDANEAYLRHYAGFAFDQLIVLGHLLRQLVEATAAASAQEAYSRQLRRYKKMFIQGALPGEFSRYLAWRIAQCEQYLKTHPQAEDKVLIEAELASLRNSQRIYRTAHNELPLKTSQI